MRLGNWLTPEEARRFWQAPDPTALKGKRDRAILAILLGCGLRRRELADLDFRHLQQREEHWAMVDLVGKGGHIRTVPMPEWVKALLDAWIYAAELRAGKLFRCVCRAGKHWGDGITKRLVWYVVKRYAAKLGFREVAPHDLRRYAESRIMPNRRQHASSGAHGMAVRWMPITGRIGHSPSLPLSCNPNLQVGGEFKGSVPICLRRRSNERQLASGQAIRWLLRQARAPSPNPAMIDFGSNARQGLCRIARRGTPSQCGERVLMRHSVAFEIVRLSRARHSRRLCAKACHAAGGELEEIQFLLGHVSVQTTERYLGL